jgi:hypothetical protein
VFAVLVWEFGTQELVLLAVLVAFGVAGIAGVVYAALLAAGVLGKKNNPEE